MADIHIIPPDIFREILLLLPAKSLIRFRAVCKGWQTILDDPCFVKAHTDKQQSSNTILIRNSTGRPYSPLHSIDLETLNPTSGIHSISATPLCFSVGGLSRLPQLPVATCNGLMLIAPAAQDWWEIWNPLTHERLQLPRRGLPTSRVFCSGFGFGYDYAADDYKAVLIFRDDSDEKTPPVCQTHVYSLKLDLWKRIENFPCGEWVEGRDRGVFVSGSLHWISSDKVIVLDLGTENYSQLELPPLHERDRPDMLVWTQQLEVLGGRLILSDYGKCDWLVIHYDVWEMNDYGADVPWTRLFTVEEDEIPFFSSSLRPIAYMKNKVQVLLHESRGGLCIYDVESHSGKSVAIHGLNRELSAQVFRETIFRLHDNCGRVSASVVPTERKIPKEKMKKSDDTKLMLCVRGREIGCYNGWYNSHDSCFGLDSNWFCSSSEDDSPDSSSSEDDSHDRCFGLDSNWYCSSSEDED